MMSTAKFVSSCSGLDDCDLVVACQQKNEAAFSVLYKRYVRFVYGLLNRLAPDLAQIHDDMVQEVFARVWKCISTLRNPRVFRTWLTQLTTNLFYDSLRQRPKEPVLSTDEPMKGADSDNDGAYLEIADTRAQPDESFERKQTIIFINAAVRELPKTFQNVLILREFYGLSYEEIALLTKTGLGTVKSRIARGRSKIQQRLERLMCA
jgi:RNA polymerase sigma factor (sigma-70 family)